MHPIDKQTVLVTGATSGLGRRLVQCLAEAGATAVAHGRDAQRPDLADLTQVHRLAGEVLDRYPQLHGLVNNAGVGFGSPGAGREISADGIELRFAVNHLASYAMSGHYFHGTEQAQPDPQADGPAMQAWLRQLPDSLVAR